MVFHKNHLIFCAFSPFFFAVSLCAVFPGRADRLRVVFFVHTNPCFPLQTGSFCEQTVSVLRPIQGSDFIVIKLSHFSSFVSMYVLHFKKVFNFFHDFRH